MTKGLCWVFISVLVFTIDGVRCCAANNRYRLSGGGGGPDREGEIIWEEKLKSGPIIIIIIIVPANVSVQCPVSSVQCPVSSQDGDTVDTRHSPAVDAAGRGDGAQARALVIS